MLRPSKHSHPDRTVLNLAVLLLARLKKRRMESYPELYEFAKRKVIGGEVLFVPSLNLLYVLGLLEYRPKTDALEYVGPDETI